ncbi:MAG: DUF2281 domain-containing protein [Pelobium sp.]
MTTAILDKIKLLPEAKQQEVEDFVNFLATKYLRKKESVDKAIENERKKNAGRLKNEIKMSNDFNHTPTDFQDYI